MEIILAAISGSFGGVLGSYLVSRYSTKRPHKHKWTHWHGRMNNEWLWHRSCKCGAIQRLDRKTGDVTIWLPDGLDSGLLDKGITRKIFEELE